MRERVVCCVCDVAVAFTDFFVNVSTGKIIYMRDGMDMPIMDDSKMSRKSD